MTSTASSDIDSIQSTQVYQPREKSDSDLSTFSLPDSKEFEVKYLQICISSLLASQTADARCTLYSDDEYGTQLQQSSSLTDEEVEEEIEIARKLNQEEEKEPDELKEEGEREEEVREEDIDWDTAGYETSLEMKSDSEDEDFVQSTYHNPVEQVCFLTFSSSLANTLFALQYANLELKGEKAVGERVKIYWEKEGL